MKPALLQSLKESGLCIDNPRLLRWIVRHPKLKPLFFRYLRLRFSPDVLTNARKLDIPLEEKSELFSLGISHLFVDGTYKTTARNRTKLADKAILSHSQEQAPRILDIGVSDGISAESYLNRLAPSDVMLSDKHPILYRQDRGGYSAFLDAYHRVMGFKVLCFYFQYQSEAPQSPVESIPIPTINPLIQQVFSIQTIQQFDLFNDTTPTPVDIIKCANILNIEYFSADQLRAAVTNLAISLAEGGIICISQNNDAYRDSEAYIVMKKTQGILQIIEEKNNHKALAILQNLTTPREHNGN